MSTDQPVTGMMDAKQICFPVKNHFPSHTHTDTQTHSGGAIWSLSVRVSFFFVRDHGKGHVWQCQWLSGILELFSSQLFHIHARTGHMQYDLSTGFLLVLYFLLLLLLLRLMVFAFFWRVTQVMNIINDTIRAIFARHEVLINILCKWLGIFLRKGIYVELCMRC